MFVLLLIRRAKNIPSLKNYRSGQKVGVSDTCGDLIQIIEVKDAPQNGLHKGDTRVAAPNGSCVCVDDHHAMRS